MIKTTAILAVVATLLTFCTATDIVFFQEGACNFARPFVQCGNVPAGFCCASGSPFCGSLSCGNCGAPITLISYPLSSCASASNSCMLQAGLNCCINLGNGISCAGSYVLGFVKRDMMPRIEGTATNVTSKETTDCNPVQLNKMTYTDPEGIQHVIHMPKGTFTTASEHIMANDFEKLAEFPAWGKS